MASRLAETWRLAFGVFPFTAEVEIEASVAAPTAVIFAITGQISRT
jgi:hypothetical protein